MTPVLFFHRKSQLKGIPFKRYMGIPPPEKTLALIPPVMIATITLVPKKGRKLARNFGGGDSGD